MTVTYQMTFSEPIPGGPCPGCGRMAPLVSQSATMGRGGQRTIVHLISDGLIQECQVPIEHGWILTFWDGTWTYQANGEPGHPIP